MKILFKKQNSNGFTLVEMLVSLFVFSIAVVVAAGSFLSVLAVNKKAQSMKTVVNNLSYAMEIMTREIRTGSDYKCSNVAVSGEPSIDPTTAINSVDCASATSVLFTNFGPTGDKRVAYIFSSDGGSTPIYTLYRWEEDGNFVPMISPSAKIYKGYFIVSADTATVQPKMQIIMSGKAGDKEKYQSEFNIQTTVSQRVK